MWSRTKFFSLAIVAVGAMALLAIPAASDNCNPNNLGDCKAAPGNIEGTLGVVGVLAGLGVIGKAVRNGGGPKAGEDTDSFLDDVDERQEEAEDIARWMRGG